MARNQVGPDLPSGYYKEAHVSLLFQPRTFRANAADLVHLKSAIREMHTGYKDLDIPVIVLADEADKTVTTSIHARQLVAALPNGELRLLPGAGHMLPHTRTDEILKAIADMPSHNDK